ncbi:uncharacterized protein ALTATR162_LOCUS4972 [Alternaria atra]|uniref:Cupin 2 conserved barrel domain-containing protein n=1 Tax=Alternaria atra TaxID=119953 RepID=A0A8J2N5N0_9PLEO|nr:uncharacterized protein ALTATR162_LOCUS4972 [Alternaria atra]CAG5157180.1 unnamed protein product [Alternaria atra]
MAATFVSPKVVKINGVWQIEGKPREDLKICARYNPSNLPGKTILVLLIDIPPNGGTPSHRHGGATAIAIPFSGTSLNQMNNQDAQTFGPGEFWYEGPGCHHQRSENPSLTETAKFYAILIVDDETLGGKTGEEYGNIFVLDKEVEMGEKAPSK